MQVAEFLNGMGRGKAQYIVSAVLAYQNGAQARVHASVEEGQPVAVLNMVLPYQWLVSFFNQFYDIVCRKLFY